VHAEKSVNHISRSLLARCYTGFTRCVGCMFQPMPGLISCAGVWEVGTTTSSKCSSQNASLSLLDHGDPLGLQGFLCNKT